MISKHNATNSPLGSTLSQKSRAIRVLLADDHPLIVEGLTTGLKHFGIEVVGHVSSAAEVIDAFLSTTPDVLVLDVRFGEHESGLDVAREILAAHPETRIIFYSQFDQDEIIFEAYSLGGLGFITKNKAPITVAEAVHAAADGPKPYFLPEIAERLALMNVASRSAPSSLTKLDAREMEVFTRMAHGNTNAEIADAMELSPKTISVTRQSVQDKLGVSRPAEITLLAVKHQLIRP
jgi:two-component system invasion response regulator UvrY